MMTGTMNFSSKTSLELMQGFDYWREAASRRVKTLAEHSFTDFQERAEKDYQIADRNA